LVFLYSYEVDMTDLDLFVEEELHLDFSKVDVGHALCDDQVSVFLSVPLVLDAEGCRIICDLNKHFFECQFTDLGSDQDSFLPLFDQF
jgi:hypothetical protein